MPPPPQVPLDPLPIPEADQVDVQPSRPTATEQMAGQPLPPSAGWVSKSGAGAYIASNILTGWMAGKHMAEQRRLERARAQVSGARQLYDTANQAYQNAVQQGMTPEQANKLESDKIWGIISDEDKAKLDQFNTTKRNLNTAYQNYLNTAEQYAFPDAGGKRPSFGKRLKREFTAQSPELYAQSSLDLMKKMRPEDLAMYGMTQEQRNALLIQQQDIERNNQLIAAGKEDADKRAHRADLEKQLELAIQKGDPKEEDKVKREMNVHGWAPPEYPSAEATYLAHWSENQKVEATKMLDRGGKLTDATPAMRLALGLPQFGDKDYYLSHVGPNDLFATEIDALKQYNRDMQSQQAVRGPSAFTQEADDVMRLGQVILAQELQTPEGAEKYHLPRPLKPGEPVPDAALAQWTIERIKPSPEDRAAVKGNINKSLSTAIERVRSHMDEKDKPMADSLWLDYSEATKQWSIRPFQPKDDAPGWWQRYGPGGPTIGGYDKQKVLDKQKEFMRQLYSYIRQMYPGADERRIEEALRNSDPAGYLIDNPAGGQTPQTPAAQPTPTGAGAGTAQTGKPQAQVEQDYMVTQPQVTGPPKRQIMRMTPEHAKQMGQAKGNWTIEPISQGIPSPF